MSLINFSKDVFSITDVGLVRQANEDNCYAAETPNGFLFIVCDGMGGHVGGAKASAIAVNSIVNFFTKERYAIIHQALTDALIFANRQILGVAAENPELKGMGTTACVVLVQEDKVWFAHVGDSRIYLFCNKQQQLHRLTKDHSVVQGLVDQGVISEAEAEHHPNKNRILKTLGIKKDIQPEVCGTPVLPANGDIFLICSDGLSGMVSDDLLQHILEQKVSLQEKGENMLTFAKQAGGTDNITLQLIQISHSPYQNSVFESKNSFYTSASSGNKRNKKFNLKIIAAIALFALALVVVLLAFKPFRNKETNEVKMPQVVTNSEGKTQMAWEKEVENRGYKILIEADGKTIYGKQLIYNKPFSGIQVKSDNSYFIGNITVFQNPFGASLGTGHYFNKDGK